MFSTTESTQTAVSSSKKSPTYGTSHKLWKFFDVGESFLVYSSYSKGNAVGVAPLPLQPFLTSFDPLLVASYKGKGTKFGQVTSFGVQASREQLSLLARKHQKKLEIIPVTPQDATVDTQFNISALVANSVSPSLESMLAHMIRGDVRTHCKSIPATTQLPLPHHYTRVETILPKRVFTTREKKELLMKGKGTYHDVCPLSWGFDIMPNCVATLLDDARYHSKGRCTYCYVEHLNGKPATNGIYTIDPKDFRAELATKLQGNGPHFIRSGQRVENLVPLAMKSWAGFSDTLPVVLEEIARAREEKDIAVAFPSKFIEYDASLAKLFIDANVTLLASIGYEALEENVIRLGATTKARLEGLVAYAKDGVKAAPYVMTDVTRGLDHVQDEAKQAMEVYAKHSDVLAGLQFLDARITKKKDAPLIAGGAWDDIKHQHGQLNFFTTPRYHLTGNGHLAASVVHDDFLALIAHNKDAIRLCYTHSLDKKNKCGKCFMDV